jgi:hypothetical protein
VRLAGVVWHDDNQNGTWDQDESGRIGQVSISIFHEQDGLIAATVSDDAGLWAVDGLPADTYFVRSTGSEDLILTSQPEYVVTLEAGQQVDGLNFGFASLRAENVRNHRVFVPVVMMAN